MIITLISLNVSPSLFLEGNNNSVEKKLEICLEINALILALDANLCAEVVKDGCEDKPTDNLELISMYVCVCVCGCVFVYLSRKIAGWCHRPLTQIHNHKT